MVKSKIKFAKVNIIPVSDIFSAGKKYISVKIISKVELLEDYNPSEVDILKICTCLEKTIEDNIEKSGLPIKKFVTCEEIHPEKITEESSFNKRI